MSLIAVRAAKNVALVTLVTLVTLVALVAPARANGRFPATTSVAFHPGDVRTTYVGSTFGLLVSADDGATWRWTCEENIGYGGTFDPVYVVSAAGTIFATTFDGLAISRDAGCSFAFATGPLDGHWASDATVATDGTIWVTTSSGALENDLFVSRDDGMTFRAAGLASARAWWKRVRTAPSDPSVVYVSGYELDDPAIDGGDGLPSPLLARSSDGGATFTRLTPDVGGESQLLLLGVSPTEPNVVFARIDGAPDDLLLRSIDSGATFDEVLRFPADLSAFVARADGRTVLAGTTSQGVRVSHDGGATFGTPAQQPRMGCVGERSDGTLFACGANWNPDRFAFGRSADGESWDKVFRFVELDGPLTCPSGAPHRIECGPLWSGLACQLGIGKGDAGPIVTVDAGPPDPTGDGGRRDGSVVDGGGGGGPGPGCGCGVSLLAGIFVPWLPLGPRRPRRPRRPRTR